MKKLSIQEAKSLFIESNYILLDSIFWDDLFLKLDLNGIKYVTIGLDYFGHKELCPVLINLNDIVDKHKIWNEFGNSYYINASNEFDYMSIFQNLIKTDAKIDEFKDYVKKLMIVKIENKKKIFRFYDSRVMMYLNYFINSNRPEFNFFTENLKKLKIDHWVINVSSEYYSIWDGFGVKAENNDYTVDFFYELTSSLRKKYEFNSEIQLNECIEKEIKVIKNG